VEEELDIKRSDSAMVISKLPRQPTSFIGREAEIAEIVSLLADPNCRLLTLIGHGGIGKTRLAIEVATQNMSAFSDGVCFVDLQPVSTIEYIVAAIADSIDIPLYGQDDPHVHLLRYLRDKHMLLVMDNFEHLLNGYGEFRDCDSLLLTNNPMHKHVTQYNSLPDAPTNCALTSLWTANCHM
jgi:predicted ATPase